jgi:hypothetical protein
MQSAAMKRSGDTNPADDEQTPTLDTTDKKRD